MSTGAERHSVDSSGFALAVAMTLAAGATLLVGPGSGVGPAALAVLAWLGVLAAASWAALVDDAASGWQRVAAIVLATGLGACFAATVESGWALMLPGLASAVALARKRSRPRFAALAAWLLTAGYVMLGAM